MERPDRPVDAEVLSAEAMPERPVLPALVGPTAVGKTALSVEVARRLDAEIISADSRQVYRELTIGTAKPTADEQAGVRHHFVDERSLSEPFSAGQFAREALERIAEIQARGKAPLVVGGSTLYLEALLHGLADIPDTSAETRARLSDRLNTEGPDSLFAELVRLDPEAAASMDATKTQRVIRALEVVYDTGTPLSVHQKRVPERSFVPRVVVLTRPRDVLYARINRRVEVMLERGLVEENRSLLAVDDLDAAPLRTIGYQEPRAFLRGEIDADAMARHLKQNSRRYAKRQLTWFRRRPEYTWLDLDATDEPVNGVLELLR